MQLSDFPRMFNSLSLSFFNNIYFAQRQGLHIKLQVADVEKANRNV